MKYNSTLPDDSVNIPKDNFFSQMLKLLFVLAFFAFLFYGALKFSLYYVVDNLSPSYEKKLTQFVSMDADFGTLKSNKYLDEITKKLSSCANLPYDIKINIIPEKNPNAFALPGGTIYITEGMLKTIRSENELVSIIGHELGHFKNRDHLKGLGVKLIFGLLSLSLGEGYGTILNTTLDISNIKYSQEAEFNADIFSLKVMNCAYKNVSGATNLFERMDDGQEWSYFFATHPAFNKRVENMKENIISKGYDTKADIIPLKEKF
jgi:Zn-dependent protease with chaperone function